MPRTLTATRRLGPLAPAARAALVLLLAVVAWPAHAVVCTATASALAFGAYDTLLSLDDDSTATVTVTCTPGVSASLTSNYTISIAGSGTGGDTIRSASYAGSRLYYQVYSDAGRTAVWGNGGATPGVASSVTSLSAALPAVRVHTVYARAPSGQRTKPGTYVGTLLVTVDY